MGPVLFVVGEVMWGRVFAETVGLGELGKRGGGRLSPVREQLSWGLCPTMSLS